MKELAAPHPVVAVASPDLAGIGAGERRRRRRARVPDGNEATAGYRASGGLGGIYALWGVQRA